MAKQVEKPEIYVRDAGPARPGIKELVVFYAKDKNEYSASFSPEPDVDTNARKTLFEYICNHRLGFIEFDLAKALYNG